MQWFKCWANGRILLAAMMLVVLSHPASPTSAAEERKLDKVEPSPAVLPQGERKLTISHGEQGFAVNVVALSPNGRLILTVSENKAKTWDATTGKQRSTIVLDHIFYSEESGKICSRTRDNRPDDLSCSALITSAIFSPDGKQILTTASWDPTAKLWTADTGALLRTFGHAATSEVTFAAFSPDGKRVLTSSSDKTARLWDAETGALLKTLEGHTGKVVSAIFSPDGTTVLTGSFDGTARLWNAETGASIWVLSVSADTFVNTSVFSPDGKRVLTTSIDRDAKLWDSRTGALLKRLSGHEDSVNDGIFSPDSRRVLTMSADKTAKLWDAETGALLHTLRHSGRFSRGYEFGCCNHLAVFSNDGKRVLTAPRTDTAVLWDVQKGSPLMEFTGGLTYMLYAATFSPDVKFVLTGHADEIDTVVLWNAPR